MIDAQSKKFRKELNAGTSALILLGLLNKADEPLYGYQISKLLERQHADKQGAIYPVLRNMVSKGLLDVEVQPSDSGPPRKYFSISPFGKEVLSEWATIWGLTRDFVDHAISGAPMAEDKNDE